jgi:hypothetical protein
MEAASSCHITIQTMKTSNVTYMNYEIPYYALYSIPQLLLPQENRLSSKPIPENW